MSVSQSQISRIEESLLLQEVIALCQRGFSPIPVSFGRKAPSLKGWTNVRITADNAREFFDSDLSNVGVLTGIDGVVDVDLDCHEAQQLAPFVLPPTQCSHGRAGAPASHWWYRVDATPRPYKHVDPGIDSEERRTIVELRSNGQQSLVPPSIHPQGERYTWTGAGSPAETDTEFLKRRVDLLAGLVIIARCWPSLGARHDAALHLSGFLLRQGMSENEVAELVEAVAALANDEEHSSRAEDARSTFKRHSNGGATTGFPNLLNTLDLGNIRMAKLSSIFTSHEAMTAGTQHSVATPSQLPFPRTDLGNAERLVDQFGGRLRWCTEWNDWLHWDGTRWNSSASIEAERLSQITVRTIHDEVLTLTDSEERRLLSRWAFTSESATRLNAMLRTARAQPGIAVKSSQLDTDPFLLNVQNGTVDLRTGELLAHDPDNLITKLCPVNYELDAHSSLWDDFLSTVMQDNAAMIDYLQRLAGYALTGDTREQAIVRDRES